MSAPYLQRDSYIDWRRIVSIVDGPDNCCYLITDLGQAISGAFPPSDAKALKDRFDEDARVKPAPAVDRRGLVKFTSTVDTEVWVKPSEVTSVYQEHDYGSLQTVIRLRREGSEVCFAFYVKEPIDEVLKGISGSGGS